MKKNLHLITRVGCLAVSATMACAAHATPILPDSSHLVNTLYADFGGSVTSVSYMAATETLSSTAAFDPIADFASGVSPLFTPPTPSTSGQFVGSFFMAAKVDHGGNLLGGTYSWVGEDSALGVNSMQALMSGTILGLDPTLLSGPDNPAINQIFATVDYFNPHLAAITPQPNFVDISYLLTDFCLGPTCPPNPPVANWNSDFVTSGIENPDLFGYVDVPEPGTFALFGVGFAATLLLMRRRRVFV